jgi:hypothetical protein
MGAFCNAIFLLWLCTAFTVILAQDTGHSKEHKQRKSSLRSVTLRGDDAVSLAKKPTASPVRPAVVPARRTSERHHGSHTHYIDVDTYVQRSTRVYHETISKRNDKVNSEYSGILDSIVPWDVSKETYLWDLFPPTFNCPFKHRLGRLSDGGKVVCNWEALRARCHHGVDPPPVVYSVGVRDEVSFEQDLVLKTGCPLHAFDHTITSVPGVPNVTFNKVGIAAHDVSEVLKSLPTLMAERNHSGIDLLKIDCEGCEWDVFAGLAASGALDSVDQVLVELHLRNPASNEPGPSSSVHDVFRFFEALESFQLFPFSRELNLYAGASHEYPWVVEYSFVKPSSIFMRDAGAWDAVAREDDDKRS